MRGCHDCEHAREIADGHYSRLNWDEVPCSTCSAGTGDDYVVEYDDERSAGHTAPALDSMKDTGSPSDGVADKLPVSVLGQFALGLLTLKPELRDVVAWRFAGLRYADIALAQGVTMACAEKRHRRALELWPELKQLFPRKVGKQRARRRRTAVRRGVTVARRGGGRSG